MFCGQCGKEITNPNGICTNCGNVQTFDENGVPQSSFEQQPQSNSALNTYGQQAQYNNNPNAYVQQPQNNYNQNGYGQQNGNYSIEFEDDYGQRDFEENYDGAYENAYSDAYENDYSNGEYVKKKSVVAKPLITALAGAAGLIAIVVICYNLFLVGPDDVAKKWVKAVNNQDFNTVYDYLPKEYQRVNKEMIMEDIRGDFDKADFEYNGRKDEENRDELGDKIETDGKIYIYDVGNETIIVFKQDGEWKVKY